MNSLSYSRGAYLLGVVLLVLFYLPSSLLPLVVGKLTVAALCFLVAGLLYMWASWRGHQEPLSVVPVLVGLLPLVYALSYILSADRAVGMLGTGIESDTLLFVTLAFSAAWLGAILFRTTASGWLFLRVLLCALLAAVAFQCIVLLFGLPGAFADRSVNLIGKWNDFGFGVLLLSFLLLVEMEAGRLSRNVQRGAPAALAVLLVLLALVNFSTAWALLLVIGIVLAGSQWFSSRRVAYAPTVAAVVAGVFLFFGASLNAHFSSYLPVASLEIRPSFQSTLSVASASHGASVKDAALGTGPNTFGMSWLMHKPAGVNASAFWNLDFTVGFSTLATAFSSTGFLGALSWLISTLLVLLGLWRVRGSSEGRTVSMTLGGSALVLFAAIILYVPSGNMLLLMFAVAGAAIGSMWRNAAPISGRWLRWAGMIVLVVLLVWVAQASVRRTLAESHVSRGSAALQAGDIDGAQAAAARSVSIEAMPENLRLVTDSGAAKLSQIAAAAAPGSEQDFSTLLQQTIAAGQRAILLDSQDYRSYVSLGNVYAFLAANKVDGAYDSAKTMYQTAIGLSPSNPALPLIQAKLEASAGTLAGVQDALKQSLTIKPDYTDAILFLAQVDIAQNDLPSAIRDTISAANTAPGVPSIWLELGLLYYSGGDTKNAIPALEQALTLESDYANAQYFLALSYAAQGRTDDALKLFQRLIQTNPDNADVKAAVANLQAGRAPLDNGTTTATGTAH